jgi:hypothetical protein
VNVWCQSLMMFVRVLAVVLLIVLVKWQALPKVEIRGLSLFAETEDDEHLAGCGPKAVLLHLTSKTIAVGEEGGVPDLVPDRSATAARLDALKKERPERMELVLFVDDDVSFERVVLFVDVARGLDYQPIVAVGPGYTAWSGVAWRRHRFGERRNWDDHPTLHWQERQPPSSG